MVKHDSRLACWKCLCGGNDLGTITALKHPWQFIQTHPDLAKATLYRETKRDILMFVLLLYYSSCSSLFVPHFFLSCGVSFILAPVITGYFFLIACRMQTWVMQTIFLEGFQLIDYLVCSGLSLCWPSKQYQWTQAEKSNEDILDVSALRLYGFNVNHQWFRSLKSSS